MLVYGWDRPRNGVSRVADNDQQIRAVGTVGGGVRFPLHIFTFALFESGWVYYAHLIATCLPGPLEFSDLPTAL